MQAFGVQSMQGMDAALVLWLRGVVATHPLLANAVLLLANVGIVLLVGALALAYVWPGTDWLDRRRAVLASLAAVALGLVLVELLGGLVARPRPFVALRVPPLFPHASDSSFPSDHTLLGVALATPLLMRRPRLGAPAFILALVVGVARVASAVHYPSDVVGSAALGLGVGALGLAGTPTLLSRLPDRLLDLAGLSGESGQPGRSR